MEVPDLAALAGIGTLGDIVRHMAKHEKLGSARLGCRILDYLVVVTSVGLNIAWIRPLVSEYHIWAFLDPPSGWREFLSLKYLPSLIVPILPSLALITLGTCVLNSFLGRTRLDGKMLPGAITSMVSACIIVISLLSSVIASLNNHQHHRGENPRDRFANLVFEYGLAHVASAVASGVIATWITLKFTNRLSLSTHHPDVLGMLIGLLWIFAAVCVWWYEAILGGEDMWFMS